MNKEMARMIFRPEVFLMGGIVGVVSKFSFNHPGLWVALIMTSFILSKFEDAIRREYNDTRQAKLERLMEEMDKEQ